jgi:hypothetical protein
VLIAECEQRLAEIDIEAIRAEAAAPRTARRLRADAVRLWRELASYARCTIGCSSDSSALGGQCAAR